MKLLVIVFVLYWPIQPFSPTCTTIVIPLGQKLSTLHGAVGWHTKSELLKHCLQDASSQDTSESWEFCTIRLELWASTMTRVLMMRSSCFVSLLPVWVWCHRCSALQLFFITVKNNLKPKWGNETSSQRFVSLILFNVIKTNPKHCHYLL